MFSITPGSRWISLESKDKQDESWVLCFHILVKIQTEEQNVASPHPPPPDPLVHVFTTRHQYHKIGSKSDMGAKSTMAAMGMADILWGWGEIQNG